MRFSLFYFGVFGALGLWLPYLPPHFEALGYSGKTIAAVSSIHSVLMIFVPPLWGFAADHSRRPTVLLRVACTGSALAFLPLLLAESVWAVAATLAVFGIFYTTISGLADSVAVVEARRTGTDWSRLRMWGSVGFVLSSTLFALWRSGGGAPSDVLLPSAALLAVAAVVSLALPRSPEASPGVPSLADAGALVRRPGFALFLLAGLVHWAALSPFHLFLAVYVDDVGADPKWTGLGLALAVGAEVAVMWTFRHLAARLPLYGLLVAAFLSGTVRWVAMAATDSGPLIAAVQVLHGLTFGAFFVASIAHLERTVPAPLRATGRALFGSVVFGLGAVVGNAFSGVLYDEGGGPLTFGAAAVVNLVSPLLLAAAALADQRERRSSTRQSSSTS